MIKRLTLALACAAALALPAQTTGGIDADLLARLRAAQPRSATDSALANAAAGASLNALSANRLRPAGDAYFSNRVNSRGITDQQSSGRCWLFTGLNVLRAKAQAEHGLGEFTFSQNYLFFYDQLEKSNLFLQAIIDNAAKPMDDQLVTWLFKHPLSDGGQFTGVSDLVMKYGLVPSSVMPETYSANHTATMSELIALKLREQALELRRMAAAGKSKADLETRKEEMLATVYHMLAVCLGEPPTKFAWTQTTASGKPGPTADYTPLSFFEKFVGTDLKKNYVMLMNDPSRPYHKAYTIDMDRHVYDGENWTYVNLPMDELKAIAIASIKDSTMLYYSCDVGKFLDSKAGRLDVDNYNYGALLGTDFGMDKADRIRTFASLSSHAMTLMAVDLDAEGRPRQWMVENSWGADAGYKGHLIMTDRWFDEYTFRLVAERKYVPKETLRLLEQEPERLPAWDPMFAPEP